LSPQARLLRVLVTRPAAQAAEWVQQLNQAGFDAAALPLIQIQPAAYSLALQLAWASLATRQCVVFVSPNAADYFFSAQPAHAVWPEHLIAAAMGPGTLRSLQRHGLKPWQLVSPPIEAAQFDSEALWEQLSTLVWQNASVLIVRGDGGREWLSGTLQRAGAQVDHVAAYRRTPPAFTPEQQTLWAAAQAQPLQHLWFFSSSEAIDNLQGLAFEPRDAHWAQAQALATHPRIGQRARQVGFGQVLETRPTVEAVLACLTLFSSAPGRYLPLEPHA
jgi:uroporphyrinogen-III synthase